LSLQRLLVDGDPGGGLEIGAQKRLSTPLRKFAHVFFRLLKPMAAKTNGIAEGVWFEIGRGVNFHSKGLAMVS